MAMDILKRIERFGIDLDCDPVFVPEGFEVIEHLKQGYLNWNPIKPQIELCLSPGQYRGTMNATKVFEGLSEFNGSPVNANALDYLLRLYPQKPWIIPESWKTVEHYNSKHILFWGTRYKYEGGICVRTLDWSADARVQVWKSGYCWVDNILNVQYPAAILQRGAAVQPSQVSPPPGE